MESTAKKRMSPQVFLQELQQIRLDLTPGELSVEAKAEILETITEMESLVFKLKKRLSDTNPQSEISVSGSNS